MFGLWEIYNPSKSNNTLLFFYKIYDKEKFISLTATMK